MKLHFFSILFLASTTGFSQGPIDGFFKGKNNFDIAGTFAYQHSETYYKGLDEIIYPRDLAIVNLFGAYGISKNFDLIGSIPFINGKFQDMSVFAKFDLIPGLFKKSTSPIHIVPAIGISFPMSNYATQTGQAIGQRATIIQPKLILQWNIKNTFIQSQGGYNYTLSPVPSSYSLSSKFGLSKGRFYTDFWFEYQKANGGLDWTDNSIDFRELGVSYSRIGGVFYYKFKENTSKPNWGGFINYSYVLDGRNTGKATTIGVGVVYSVHYKNKG